ncbi:hypothetical protein ERJ75_000030000 [Trypanosoma vivax]|nr:hypothetical protein ERJ75_000030000 [Trypanosoma vivax]
MAGLVSDNISVASIRTHGYTSERDTCVFCGKRAVPLPTDPLAPVFAFFSLVDCRHYACQPCALVHCDNAGRYICCPSCHAVSRLAQTGRRRRDRREPRTHIDDGVSSSSRKSLVVSKAQKPLRSALARSDRRRRTNSVQFSSDLTTTSRSSDHASGSNYNDGPECSSPLTRDAVEKLPADPTYSQRKRRKELIEGTVTTISEEERVSVNLYNIKGVIKRRRLRKVDDRAHSVPLPLTEHRYLPPPVPFHPPPPLIIHTVEEEEEAAENETLVASFQEIAEEIEQTIRATLEKEVDERKTIGIAEEYRRKGIASREAQEKGKMALELALKDDTQSTDVACQVVDVSESPVSDLSEEELAKSLVGRTAHERQWLGQSANDSWSAIAQNHVEGTGKATSVIIETVVEANSNYNSDQWMTDLWQNGTSKAKVELGVSQSNGNMSIENEDVLRDTRLEGTNDTVPTVLKKENTQILEYNRQAEQHDGAKIAADMHKLDQGLCQAVENSVIIKEMDGRSSIEQLQSQAFGLISHAYCVAVQSSIERHQLSNGVLTELESEERANRTLVQQRVLSSLAQIHLQCKQKVKNETEQISLNTQPHIVADENKTRQEQKQNEVIQQQEGRWTLMNNKTHEDQELWFRVVNTSVIQDVRAKKDNKNQQTFERNMNKEQIKLQKTNNEKRNESEATDNKHMSKEIAQQSEKEIRNEIKQEKTDLQQHSGNNNNEIAKEEQISEEKRKEKQQNQEKESKKKKMNQQKEIQTTL